MVKSERKKVIKIIGILKREYPNARIALNFSNPLELLVATMLSAQCTDKRVNQVTKTLFKKYRSAEDYANADIEEIEEIIRPTGFYHVKARNLKNCCVMLVEKFNSKVPQNINDLVLLPGVARKTANIVLANAYNIVEGIAVDTHVRRLSKRLNFTKKNDPNQIEIDLMKIVPRDEWFVISYLLIDHGREICGAKKPLCYKCPLNELCSSAFTFQS